MGGVTLEENGSPTSFVGYAETGSALTQQQLDDIAAAIAVIEAIQNPTAEDIVALHALQQAQAAGMQGIGAAVDLAGNPDPFVTGVISVLNFTGSTQTFTLNYLQPVAPVVVNGVGTGSVAIAIQDVFNSGTGTLASAGGAPIYNPEVDGGVFGAGQLLAGTTLNVTTAGETVSTNASFGPTAVGAVNTSLGIEIEFSLTNLDLATGTSIFEVVEIPEPSTIVLLGLGALVMAIPRCVRRRK